MEQAIAKTVDRRDRYQWIGTRGEAAGGQMSVKENGVTCSVLVVKVVEYT